MARKVADPSAAMAAEDPSGPKTTRPDADERRPPELPAEDAAGPARSLDAMPDRVDARDWFYRPGLGALPDVIVNCDRVPAILQQGQEGACTGFALAAVINFLLSRRVSKASVSPRMIYEMARRYDEWPGEDYDGSSARGAMKGWVRHGVCTEPSWPTAMKGPENFTDAIAQEARLFPGGAFYRVNHREIRDVHAALADVGIVFMTLMVHSGWDVPGPALRQVDYFESGSIRSRELPVIARTGRADRGHAVAIVGYSADGFIVQNSWGEEWGDRGFALLPYEDFLLHAVDLWVAQLGVPVSMDLWARGADYADSTAGISRATVAVPLADIRPYAIDVGNNGELSAKGDYWTTRADLDRLFSDYLPQRTQGWAKRRVMLYLHGGLNDERAVARRIVAMRDVCLANEIYPIHVMWESGAMESVQQILEDLTQHGGDRAGSSWLGKLRDGVLEARDLTLELTVALPGGALWREMKENARLSSQHEDGKGGLQLLAQAARAAMAPLTRAQRSEWEFHVVSHSAGSIYGAYGLEHTTSLGVPLASFPMMAPAITMELFRKMVLPRIRDRSCPVPDVYLMSDTGERDDKVGPYGKSLLYLVSNAFEGRRDMPLLGMERYVRVSADARNAKLVDPEVAALLAKSLVVAGEPADRRRLLSRSDSHGGFDNDADTMTSILRRILGGAPRRPFLTRDLQY